MQGLGTKAHNLTVNTFYLLLLATPWIWIRANSELFEFPKMIFVYLATIVITGLWLTRTVAEKKLTFQPTRFDIPLLLFFFSQAISTILSIHPRTSILGYYSRFHGGLLSTTAYLLLYYAFVSNFNQQQARRALAVIISSAFIASLYALPEHFGASLSCMFVNGSLGVDCWIQDVQTRIFGTFGQPNWLAAYLVTTIPLVWAFLIIKTTGMSKSTLAYSKISLLIIIQAIMFATLVFTRSRSGLLALAAGFVAFWIIIFSKTKLTHKYTFLTVTISLALIVGIFGTEYTPSFSQLISRSSPQTSTTQQTGTVLETGDLSLPAFSTGGTESGKIREIVWQGALEVFKYRPLFGTGAETFAYSYYNHRHADHNLVSEWDFLYNKAHNEFFNFAANTGVAGLFSYLAILTLFIATTLVPKISTKLNNITKTLPISNQVLLAAMGAGIVSLSVSNFFGFSTVAVGLLFFIFPAITSLLFKHKSTVPIQKPISLLEKKLIQLLAITLVLGLSLTSAISLSRYYLADIAFAQAESADNSGDLNTAINKYGKAIHLSPNEPTYKNSFANALSKAAVIQASSENIAQATQLAQIAFQQSADTLKGNKVHINFYKTQAGVFIRLSVLDETLLEVAKTILEDAYSLAPTDAKLPFNLGLIALDQDQQQAAVEYFEDAVGLKSNYEQARLELASLYTAQGETQKAREQYQFILNFIAPSNTSVKDALDLLDIQPQ